MALEKASFVTLELQQPDLLSNCARNSEALDVDEADGGFEQQPDLIEHGSREMGSRGETAAAVTKAVLEQQPVLLEHGTDTIGSDKLCDASLASNTVADKPAVGLFTFAPALDEAHEEEPPDLASVAMVD